MADPDLIFSAGLWFGFLLGLACGVLVAGLIFVAAPYTREDGRDG